MSREKFTLNSLGTLFIIDVYIYYDGPQLFLCESVSGQKYLALNIEENDDANRWFYLPISKQRLVDILQGKITLYTGYRKAEDGFVWEITIDNEGEDTSKILRCLDINDNDLPDTEATLSIDVATLPELSERPEALAERVNRDVLDISLETNEHRNEISCEHLGSVLSRLQNLVYSLAHGTSSNRGRIPNSVKEQSALNVTQTFAASFGVRLEAATNPQLFEEAPVTNALNTLINLMEAKDNHESLRGVIKSISARSLSRYKFLLKSLSDGNIGLKVDFGSPGKQERNAYLSKAEIGSVLQLLDEEGENLTSMIQLNGTLIGINVERNTFNFKDDNEEKYSGVLGESLQDVVFEVPARVTVELEETLELQSLTNEERIVYKLIRILPQ